VGGGEVVPRWQVEQGLFLVAGRRRIGSLHTSYTRRSGRLAHPDRRVAAVSARSRQTSENLGLTVPRGDTISYDFALII
jgi:hypothetical protein